ncbi:MULTISPECIES: hypothetical protein [Nocardia]|uniref:hypothetical protein n=1 Tax=Nocardia TaxID=1817 RepID=UPI000BF096EC|nr:MULTISPECIES: hypothetical protein [Nocardia]PEH79471.1 hypothetical protein CRM89_28735 [Nocardia sp. FDAARGOS_372]
MARYPRNPDDDDSDDETWVDLPASPGLRLVTGTGSDPSVDEPEPPSGECWAYPLRHTPTAAEGGGFSGGWGGIGHRLPGGAWAALAALVAVLAAVLVVSADEGGDTGHQATVTTAAPPSSTTTAQGPCTGLTGTVVTDRAGDRATLEGLIASFEAAYYIDRDAAKAMLLLAPETGITVEGLAAGIATIPPGTRHCVAITPIAATAATVHIVELHPDRTRTDYLQLINTRPAEPGGALVISNFQKQG